MEAISIYLINDEHEGNWGYEGEYETIEEAIEAGKKEIGESFYIGEKVKYLPSISVDIVEDLISNAEEECGEWTYGWLDNLKSEQIDDLNDKVLDVVYDWLKKYDNMPTFFLVKNIHHISELK